jgi:two-component system sensor kinase FixL
MAVHLFRIVQEAISNAIKHGHASHIIMRVSSKPEAQILEIIDNGQGMNVGALVPGVGLRSMRFRADLIGAKLDILDREGGGTRVVITCAIRGED